MVFSQSLGVTILWLLTVTLSGAPPPRPLVLKAAHLWLGKDERLIENAFLVIEGDRIKAVGSNLALPEGAEVVDLGSATLLPGLIDCHTHLLSALRPELSNAGEVDEIAEITHLSTAERALRGSAKGKEMLDAGFTTVRDLGNSGINGDIALREAINKGWVVGPRIQASTRALSPIGGQYSKLAKEAQGLVGIEYVEISSPPEARKAVQQACADTADCIKVIANAAEAVIGLEEMKALVAEAHRRGKKVAAHATTDAGIDVAIEAGVDSIEHAYEIKDEPLRAMAKKGITLVPTDSTIEMVQHFYKDPLEWKRTESEWRTKLEALGKRLRRAREFGVRIAAGSDVYYRFPGMTRGQAAKDMFRAYAIAGLSPLEVLRSTTTSAAELLGWSDRIGTLEVGKFADVIAVPGNPLKDPAPLKEVVFVMKGGAVVRSSTTPIQ